MSKLPECDRCQFNAHSVYLVCAIHPSGIQGGGTHTEGNRCPDFLLDPEFKEMWSPIGFRLIDSQLVRKPIVYSQDFEPRLTRSQQ